MNDQSAIYSKLLEAVTLAQDDLTRPSGPALPAPTPSRDLDPKKAVEVANRAVADLHESMIDHINTLRSRLDSAEATLKLALGLVTTHQDRYGALASDTLEGIKIIDKAVDEITQQAASNGK